MRREGDGKKRRRTADSQKHFVSLDVKAEDALIAEPAQDCRSAQRFIVPKPMELLGISVFGGRLGVAGSAVGLAAGTAGLAPGAAPGFTAPGAAPGSAPGF